MSSNSNGGGSEAVSSPAASTVPAEPVMDTAAGATEQPILAGALQTVAAVHDAVNGADAVTSAAAGPTSSTPAVAATPIAVDEANPLHQRVLELEGMVALVT